MKSISIPTTLLLAGLCMLAGCKPKSSDEASSSKKSGFQYDAATIETASKLKPSRDPIADEAAAFTKSIREAFKNRRFDELEKIVSELRTKKELLRDGKWKITSFYSAFGGEVEDPESLFEQNDRIHQEWLAAKPASAAARIAHAIHLTDYAWKARGNGYADSVSKKSWELFGQRLDAAMKILLEARALPEKDPYLYRAALTIAMGQGWSKKNYDALVAEAHTLEPTYWGYDTARAYSLLPRWYGEPGDWEKYAEEVAALPGGLGLEAYARIVIGMEEFYGNVFTETKASWPKTRDGLAILRKKYPESSEILTYSAMFAAMTDDQAVAREMFDQLGDTYLPGPWRSPERFAQYRRWSKTGFWNR